MSCDSRHSFTPYSALQTHLRFATLLLTLGLSSPAFAQLQKAQQTLSNIQIFLAGIAVLAVTIAIMFAGFKMIFQHAKWSEISNIVMGSIFIGGAAGFATWMLS